MISPKVFDASKYLGELIEHFTKLKIINNQPQPMMINELTLRILEEVGQYYERHRRISPEIIIERWKVSPHCAEKLCNLFQMRGDDEETSNEDNR